MSEPAVIEEAAFNVASHMTEISGRPYVPVKVAQAWFIDWCRREEYLYDIVTDLVEHEPMHHAVFRCTIKVAKRDESNDEAYRVRFGTGYGMEAASDFPEYLEKAESKAKGRALAAVGFGTIEGSEDAGIAYEGGRREVAARDLGERQQRTVSGPASQRQLGYLRAVGREAGFPDEASLDNLALERYGVRMAALTRGDASDMIDHMQLQAPLPADEAETIYKTAQTKGYTVAVVNRRIKEVYGRPINQLTRGEGQTLLKSIEQAPAKGEDTAPKSVASGTVEDVDFDTPVE